MGHVFVRAMVHDTPNQCHKNAIPTHHHNIGNEAPWTPRFIKDEGKEWEGKEKSGKRSDYRFSGFLEAFRLAGFLKAFRLAGALDILGDDFLPEAFFLGLATQVTRHSL